MADMEQHGSERERQLKAFDNTKAGVKGLVDSGISTIPPFFVTPSHSSSSKAAGPPSPSTSTLLQIPVIDLHLLHEDPLHRNHIIEQVRSASQTWGFFQVVNHGIPTQLLHDMIRGVRRFHQLPHDAKKDYYSRDISKKFRFISNFDLYHSAAANWRDTLICVMAPHAPNPQDLPAACREITIEYSRCVRRLGVEVLELLSQALGLKRKHLEDMECLKGQVLFGHYYPECPEPHRTMGTSEHSDPDFFTVLLQDHMGGLQVLYQDEWVDIQPLEGGLVINLGDLIQLISNDRFKSAKHRVVANLEGPRISVASFFSTHQQPSELVYGPIQELLSETSPALYAPTRVSDYVTYYNSKGLGGYTALQHFRLPSDTCS